MFKCKSCGGDMIFNIAGQDMECMFCGNHFPVTDFSESEAGGGGDTYETTVYTCKMCGGELISPDNSAVAFCSFCGTETVLEGRISNEVRPHRIIPFKKTKEECKKIYAEKAKSEPYVPKEFKDPEFLEKFRGIYMPYWEYDIGFTKEPELRVREEYSEGDYNVSKEYTVRPELRGTSMTIPCDASSSFDDEIASQIAPFRKEDMKDFNSAYLAGFFADTADVDQSVYVNEAIGMAQDHVISNVTNGFHSGARVEIPSDARQRAQVLGTEAKGCNASLYPVWFLTWRKGDRLAYGVVNGETGKISAELPVDIKQFLKVSGIIALIVFVLMTVTGALLKPATVLLISAIAALVVQYYYRKEVKAIKEKETNENNLGALKGDELKKFLANKADRRRARDTGGMAKLVFPIVVVFGIAAMVVLAGDSSFSFIGCLVVFIVGMVFFVTTIKHVSGIREKGMTLGIILPVVAEFIALVFSLTDPIQDWKYYLGSMIGLAAVAATSLSLIMEYNNLTTRSIPDFHNREGGNKDAGR